MPRTKSKHLVYGLYDPRTNELCYIGKSSIGLKRPRCHLHAPSKKLRNFCTRWLRKLYKLNLKPTIKVLKRAKSGKEAFDVERELIAKALSEGCELMNMTSGGEGSVGFKHTKESKKKMSAVAMGRKFSEETREKLRVSATGRRHSKEAIEKMRAANIGRKHTAETIKKMSEIQTCLRTPERRRQVASERTRKKASKEAKANMSAAGYRRDPPSKETREKLRIASTDRRHSEETKAEMSRTRKGRKMSDETRKKMSDSGKERCRRNPQKHSPESKAKMSASQKRRFRREKQNDS